MVGTCHGLGLERQGLTSESLARYKVESTNESKKKTPERRIGKAGGAGEGRKGREKAGRGGRGRGREKGKREVYKEDQDVHVSDFFCGVGIRGVEHGHKNRDHR
jgi:hypothetical protein